MSDTGCGISPQDCEVVFERLAQVKSTTEASRSGLGLGLFISRELVLLHGGRIWVESQLGSGSTFYFTLPVFSLSKLCAPVFSAPSLEDGSVTLIAVDVVAVEAFQTNILPEVRRVLERCIRPGQDVLLPLMNEGESLETFFIVAWTNASGGAVMATRIDRQLQKFDDVAKLKPEISSTTLLMSPGQPREAQINEVMTQIERLVHIPDKERRQCLNRQF